MCNIKESQRNQISIHIVLRLEDFLRAFGGLLSDLPALLLSFTFFLPPSPSLSLSDDDDDELDAEPRLFESSFTTGVTKTTPLGVSTEASFDADCCFVLVVIPNIERTSAI